MRKSTSALLCAACAMLALAGSPGQAQEPRTMARAHLGKAQALLQGVPTKNFSTDKDDDGDAAEEVEKLRRQFDELVKAFEASPDASSETGWKLKFSEIERTLARIIGGGSIVGPVKAGAAVSVQPGPRPNVPAGLTGVVEVPAGGVATPASPPASTPPSSVPNTVPPAAGRGDTPPPAAATTTDPVPVPVGTSGGAAGAPVPAGTSGTPASGSAVTGDVGTVAAAAKVSTIGIKRLNPDVRKQLEMFRTEIELFYVAPVGERASHPR